MDTTGLTALIAGIAEAIVAELVAQSIGLAKAKLQKDPTKKALENAITSGLKKYAESETYRRPLAKQLSGPNGPLELPPVVTEIARLFRFDGEPDYSVIGRYWRSVMDEPPLLRDLAVEAQFLVGFIRNELMDSPVFQPAFTLKTLDALADDIGGIAENSERIRQLQELIYSKLAELANMFETSSHDVQFDIVDFGSYMSERTEEFTGRDFVFNQINAFTQTPRGYFLVTGLPGMGKTALAAQYVKQNGCIHHFNRRSIRLNTADAFLKNTCAQLIAAYRLDEAEARKDSVLSGATLVKILHKVAAKRRPGHKTIIVVDSLDEADILQDVANTLYLPDESDLPPGTFFIITMRKNADVMLPKSSGMIELYLEPKSPENVADIHNCITRWLPKTGIQAYIHDQNLNDAGFVDALAKSSEYNFMYLRHMLPTIESGQYQKRKRGELPQGLERFYTEHWTLMRNQGSEDDWINYKLAVLWALVEAQQPLPVDVIARFAGIEDVRRVMALLQPRAWGQFLNIQYGTQNGQPVKLYSIYHAAFQDFLKEQDEIVGHEMSLAAKRRIIQAFHGRMRS